MVEIGIKPKAGLLHEGFQEGSEFVVNHPGRQKNNHHRPPTRANGLTGS